MKIHFKQNKNLLLVILIVLGNLLNAQTGIKYTYDANGNRTKKSDCVQLIKKKDNDASIPKNSTIDNNNVALFEDSSTGVKADVYPSPNNGNITVAINSTSNEQVNANQYNFVVYDYTGRVLFNGVLNGNNTNFNLADAGITNGAYYYSISTVNGKIVKQQKLVVVR